MDDNGKKRQVENLPQLPDRADVFISYSEIMQNRYNKDAATKCSSVIAGIKKTKFKLFSF